MEEILHQLVGSLSHCFQGFIHPKWCRISSINNMTGRLGKQFHFLVNHHLLGAKVTTGCSVGKDLFGVSQDVIHDFSHPSIRRL